jgi:hypothetical protein
MTQFQKDMIDAVKTERIIALRLKSIGWQVAKVKHDKYPFDLVAKRGNKCISLEVKSFGCERGDRAFFETASTSTGIAPQYLRHSQCVDYVVRYNKEDGMAYVIDNSKLSHLLKTVDYRKMQNAYGTAEGVVLNASSAEIGCVGVLR